MLLDALAIIEGVRDDEQEAYDNMPEGLQCSERGEQMYEYVSTLDDAVDSINDTIDYLNEIMEG